MRLSYLACPYSSPSTEVRRNRQFLADLFAARLAHTTAVFSPITHGTRLEAHLPPVKVKSHKFWMDQCIPLLRVCSDIYVLPIPGWRESEGVRIEIELARQLLMPIRIIQSHDHGLELIDLAELQATGWRTEWLEAPTPRGGRSHAAYKGE